MNGEFNDFDFNKEFGKFKDFLNNNQIDVQVVIPDNLMDFIKQLSETDVKESGDDEKACPVCGKKLSEIKKDLMVGCEVCYQTFKRDITRLLNDRRLMPELSRDTDTEQRKLQEELMIAIRTENYERAAEITSLLGADNDNQRL